MLAAVFLLGADLARAHDWFFLLEPRFMEHEISFPLSGAKNTVLAPARVGETGVEFPTVAGWSEAGLDEESVMKVTARMASDWLRHAKIEFVRGRKNVLEFAALRSEKFPVSATIFAPEFRSRFADAFGPKLLLVVPNRQTIFIFPGVAGELAEHAPMILEAWRSAAPKVSLEVFELSARGMRATGRIEEP